MVKLECGQFNTCSCYITNLLSNKAKERPKAILQEGLCKHASLKQTNNCLYILGNSPAEHEAFPYCM